MKARFQLYIFKVYIKIQKTSGKIYTKLFNYIYLWDCGGVGLEFLLKEILHFSTILNLEKKKPAFLKLSTIYSQFIHSFIYLSKLFLFSNNFRFTEKLQREYRSSLTTTQFSSLLTSHITKGSYVKTIKLILVHNY